MITSREEFDAEIKKAFAPLVEAVKEAQKEALGKLTNTVGVNNAHRNLHREVNEHHKRPFALPPNLRSVVGAGIEISLAERFFEKSGRDLSDEEVYQVRLALQSRVCFSPKDLQEIGKRFSEELAPKPIKQVPQGIPWGKKVTINGYRK